MRRNSFRGLLLAASMMVASCSSAGSKDVTTAGPDVATNDIACEPDCLGKTCGDDGCGGSCGACAAEETCTSYGSCTCTPQCDGVVFGSDGCGGSCGDCGLGHVCEAGACVLCVPACAGVECGDDGCGGECGNCTLGPCVEGHCTVDCDELCKDLECGLAGPADDCDCGKCKDGFACEAGTCVEEVCVPDCIGKECGTDDCGGSCGECEEGFHCAGEFCEEDPCLPDCDGKVCGDDGCDGSCGECGDGFNCETGQCLCQPDCVGQNCGDDGCGGSCGECGVGTYCMDGSCDPNLPPVLEWVQEDPGPPPEGPYSYTVEGIAWPADGWSLACLVDGTPVAATVEDAWVTFPLLPPGMHNLCCRVTEGGEPLLNCEATACLAVKVKGPCNGFDDECDDDNPCSVETCLQGTDGYECAYGLDLSLPDCCQGDIECPCGDNGWMSCNKATSSCEYKCLEDAECDDGNPCTVDSCTLVEGSPDCSNETIAGCCQIDADCPDGNICQNNVCVENTYTCADILICATGCNFSEQCITQCFENASPTSQGLFSSLALCIVGVCGQNLDVPCFLQATAGTCAGQLADCQAD